MEIIQGRADLGLVELLEALHFLCQHYSHSFIVLRMSVVLCKPGFAPSSIYTADNLGSPQVESTSKPWLDLAWGEPGLGRFTLVNLGQIWGKPAENLQRIRDEPGLVCAV